MAAVTPRTQEQIQRELQLVHPEIPVDQLQRCLEEHNYDAVVVEEMLHPVNMQHHSGQPGMNHHPHSQRDTYANNRMDRQPSPHSQGRAPHTSRTGRSVSADNSRHMVPSYGYRAPPDGRSMDAPRFIHEGRPAHHHVRSRTTDDGGWEIIPRVPAQKHLDSLHVNTGFALGSQPNSPRASPRASPRQYHDTGMWMAPRKENHRSEASLNLSYPERRPPKQPEPFEMVDRNLLTTQLLPPPIDQSTPLKPAPSPSPSHSVVEESQSLGGRFSPLMLPWEQINPEMASPGGVNDRRRTSHEGELAAGTTRQQQPGNQVVADWSQMSSSPQNNPKSPPYMVTSISSPVSSPKISMKFMQNPLDERLEANRTPSPRPVPPWAMPPTPDEPRESNQQTDNAGVDLKKQSLIQALLAHQKARYSLMERRVNEARAETEDMRQELAQMENELTARRTSTPSVATPDAISRLRDEKQRLQIDIEVLSRDIMYLSKQRAGNHSQDEFAFYTNMPDQDMYNHHIPLPPQTNRTPSDPENNPWNCQRCSFANHQFLTECEMCCCPRDSVVSVEDHS